MSTEDTPEPEQTPPEAAGADDELAATARFEGERVKAAEIEELAREANAAEDAAAQVAADPDETADETIVDPMPAPRTEDAGDHANPAHAHLEFSPQAKDRIEWLRTRYPADHQRALILPILSMAQREFGWVSQEVIHHVAAQIPVPPMWVEQVATFYTMYNKAPIGRWHLQVCHNISCALMGAEIVIEHIEEKLGIEAGQTTDDGEFTLIGAECLGSCGTAPMMQVNDHYYENLSLKDVDDLLDRLRSTADAAPDPKDLVAGPGSGPSRALPRDGQALDAGHGIVIPHPGHDDHGPDPKARPPLAERPLAQDPDSKGAYTPQGVASP